MNTTDSTKKRARAAGYLYLLLAVTSIFGLIYIPSKFIVPGDTATTVYNIKASPLIFKLGALSNLVYLVVFVFLVLAFYNLFKDVNKKWAQLMVVLVLVAIPIAFVNELNKFAISILLSTDNYLKVFGSVQLNTTAQLFLDFYEYGSYMVMLFFGLWLFPLGLLVIKSRFIPRILGYSLIIGCFGYIVSSFTFLLFPQYGRMVFPIATIPSAIAEFSLILWLLIKGTSEEKSEIRETTLPGHS